MANDTRTQAAVSVAPRGVIAGLRSALLFAPLDELERLFDRLMPQAWLRTTMWNGLESRFGVVRTRQLDVIDRHASGDGQYRCQ
jgi:hypothetical protein